MVNKTILYIVIIIMVIVIIGLLWHIKILNQSITQVQTSEKALPHILDSEKRKQIVQEYAKHWNAGDAKSINRMFGIEPDTDLVGFLERWRAEYGNILEGEYSNYEYVEDEEGEDLLHLIYSIRFEKEDNGGLILSVYCTNDSCRLSGFNVGVF